MFMRREGAWLLLLAARPASTWTAVPFLGVSPTPQRTRCATPIVAVESWYDRQVREQQRKQALEAAAAEGDAADLSPQEGLQSARNRLALELRAREDSARLSILKRDIITTGFRLDRGANATAEDQAEMEAMARELESLSPISDRLGAPELNGRWQLAYTTSSSILGIGKRFKPFGPIRQTLDVPTLTARNDELIKWGPIRINRFVRASLDPDPTVENRVRVHFKRFGISFLRIPAPKSAVGELDITYLDKSLRISRGQNGNLFVLFKDERFR